MSTSFYVYALLDPRKDGQPFYIGKGRGTRAWQHTAPTNRDKRYSQFKNAVIDAIEAAGMKVGVEILFRDLAEDRAFEIEQELIGRYGRRGIDGGGILTNRTTGGEGCAGRVVSDSERKLRSDNLKGKPIHQNTRAAISERNAGLEWTDEMRERVGAKHRGKTLSPEHRKALIKAARRPRSEETKRRMAEAAKEAWARRRAA